MATFGGPDLSRRPFDVTPSHGRLDKPLRLVGARLCVAIGALGAVANRAGEGGSGSGHAGRVIADEHMREAARLAAAGPRCSDPAHASGPLACFSTAHERAPRGRSEPRGGPDRGITGARPLVSLGGGCRWLSKLPESVTPANALRHRSALRDALVGPGLPSNALAKPLVAAWIPGAPASSQLRRPPRRTIERDEAPMAASAKQASRSVSDGWACPVGGGSQPFDIVATAVKGQRYRRRCRSWLYFRLNSCRSGARGRRNYGLAATSLEPMGLLLWIGSRRRAAESPAESSLKRESYRAMQRHQNAALYCAGHELHARRRLGLRGAERAVSQARPRRRKAPPGRQWPNRSGHLRTSSSHGRVVDAAAAPRSPPRRARGRAGRGVGGAAAGRCVYERPLRTSRGPGELPNRREDRPSLPKPSAQASAGQPGPSNPARSSAAASAGGHWAQAGACSHGARAGEDGLSGPRNSPGR